MLTPESGEALWDEGGQSRFPKRPHPHSPRQRAAGGAGRSPLRPAPHPCHLPSCQAGRRGAERHVAKWGSPGGPSPARWTSGRVSLLPRCGQPRRRDGGEAGASSERSAITRAGASLGGLGEGGARTSAPQDSPRRRAAPALHKQPQTARCGGAPSNRGLPLPAPPLRREGTPPARERRGRPTPHQRGPPTQVRARVHTPILSGPRVRLPRWELGFIRVPGRDGPECPERA